MFLDDRTFILFTNFILVPSSRRIPGYLTFLYTCSATALFFTCVSLGFVIKERTITDMNSITYHGKPIHEVHLKAIPVSMIQEKIRTSDNYRDIFRLFLLDQNIPDHIIDELIAARSYQSLFPSYGNFELSNDIQAPMNPDAAFKHLQEMMIQSQCHIPQPECIQIQNIAQTSSVYYMPKCTMVYRCSDTTGCCPEGFKCGPVKIEQITRHFFALNYVAKGRGSNTVLPPEDFIETFTFENHTECGCQALKDAEIGRCVKCPFPYVLTKGAPFCDCDCHRDDTHCRRVKLGQSTFTEDALVCIKVEECHLPVCEYGEFDMESIRIGKCPSNSQMKDKVADFSGNSLTELPFMDDDTENNDYFQNDAPKIPFPKPTKPPQYGAPKIETVHFAISKKVSDRSRSTSKPPWG
ncbi:uncharacterized protein LOC141905558 [Tubulanus polymorphus]|uniref:uncharacterized protein LOC141905558 n=1 Tax=Tubulanus polymorphus TaxID=672921 RepID=UPI003DA333C1